MSEQQTAIDEHIKWLEDWEHDAIKDYRAMRLNGGGAEMIAVDAQRSTIREALAHAKAAKERRGK